MAVMDSEYIENNVDKVLDFIENYPHRQGNYLYYIGHRTNNPRVLQAIYDRGVTQEMLDETRNN